MVFQQAKLLNKQYKDYAFRGFLPNVQMCPNLFLDQYQTAPRPDEMNCKIHETFAF